MSIDTKSKQGGIASTIANLASSCYEMHRQGLPDSREMPTAHSIPDVLQEAQSIVMKLEAHLRAFAGFVRRGSFSGAAEELCISQPAVSKHIADMERGLGVKLIERRSRTLTVAGEFLASHVLRAEAILAQAALGVVALREPGLSTLSIMASGTPGTYLLPEVIASFQQARPGVRFTFELGTSAEVVQAVRSHRAEIGVVGGFVAAPEIEAEPLIEDEIVIIGPPSFKGRRMTRDKLEALTWISREEGSATRVVADLEIVK